MDDVIKKYPWVLPLKNTIIGIAIIGALAYFIIISAQEARKDLERIFQEERTDVTKVQEVLATGYDFELVVEDGKRKQYFGRLWELDSGIVEMMGDKNESIAREIRMLRIYKDDELNLIATGDTANYNKSREELRMEGNVVIISEDDSTILKTDVLIWRDHNKEMSCPKPVDIWIDDNHILADMMFSDKDMEKIDFLGRVSMHVSGFEQENFATKEGWIDWEDVKPTGERDEDDVMNVECEYLHYNKEKKYAEAYPYIPHMVEKKYQRYLRREDFRPQARYAWQSGFTQQPKPQPPEEDSIPKVGETTGLEGFESIIRKDDEKDEVEEQDVEVESAPDELTVEARPRRASLDEEPFPGLFPDREYRQVYCWKQNKKIFSNRLDIDLNNKILKPRVDVYIWAFDLKKEIDKKHDREDKDPSKMARAVAKETTEIFGDYMNVQWRNDFIEAWGGVTVRQKDKLFRSENMVYSDNLGLMQADGDVFLEQIDGEWLEREGLLEDMTDEDAKESAKKPTIVTADAMISYDDKDYVYMIGDVWIQQDDQNIMSDEAELSDSEDIIIFTGNVRYRNKDGERLNAQNLTLYTEENRYIAHGAAYARSLVPEEYEDDLKELESQKAGTDETSTPPSDPFSESEEND